MRAGIVLMSVVSRLGPGIHKSESILAFHFLFLSVRRKVKELPGALLHDQNREGGASSTYTVSSSKPSKQEGWGFISMAL